MTNFRLILIMFLASVLFMAAVFGMVYYSALNPPEEYVAYITTSQQKLEDNLANDPAIIAELNAVNDQHQHLSAHDIQLVDKEWQESNGDYPLSNELLTNIISDQLKEFRREHQGFAEIFITDLYGLNAGQTNKTSDYYQADEAWWQQAYNSGIGDSYFGKIEYDESARKWSVPVYVPVKDDHQQIIGIIKALLDVDDIR